MERTQVKQLLCWSTNFWRHKVYTTTKMLTNKIEKDHDAAMVMVQDVRGNIEKHTLMVKNERYSEARQIVEEEGGSGNCMLASTIQRPGEADDQLDKRRNNALKYFRCCDYLEKQNAYFEKN